jgi:hypothetical protein
VLGLGASVRISRSVRIGSKCSDRGASVRMGEQVLG